ncbi:MAG TPA: diguanylate cyclase [Bacilli bacterium]|nr:diguanylate cyclase [Bacilli bacterium]
MQQENISIALLDPELKISEQVRSWFSVMDNTINLVVHTSVDQLVASLATVTVDVVFVSTCKATTKTNELFDVVSKKFTLSGLPIYVIAENVILESINESLHSYGFMGAISLPIDEHNKRLILDSIIREVKNKHNMSYYFEQYLNLVSQMPQGLALHEVVFDQDSKVVDYRFISVNDSYEQLTGLKAVEIIGKTVKEVLPEVEQSWIDVFGQVAITGIPCEYENYTAPIGRYFRTNVYSPRINQFVTIVEDITDRVNMTRQLRYDNQRFTRIMESAADVIFEIDSQARYVTVFGRGIQKMKQSTDMFIGKTPTEVYGKEGKDKLDYYRKCLKGQVVTYQWTHHDKSQTLYFESIISPMYDENRKIIGGVGVSRDITEQKKKTIEIEYLSSHDYLTGLYNRRYFVDQLKTLNIPNSYPLGIMMIDVNGLKILNDAYGHQIGDIALITIANLLKTFFRNQDVVARIGGDEFAIILPDTSNDDMEHMKNSLNKSMSNILVENVPLSLAIGYEAITDTNRPIEEVMRLAENFMYRNKLSASKSVRNNSIKAILKTLTDKYTEEKTHSKMVSSYCKKVGEALRIKSDELKELELAGLFHDIGKISIPDRILDKPGKLTNEEYQIIKSHPESGYQILRAADEYSDLAIHALYHHERWDGTGYPKGLKGKDIPLYSRIIAVADAYEAMTSNRSYRAKLGKDVAIEEIKRCSGTQFDPTIAKVFVEKVLGAKW